MALFKRKEKQKKVSEQSSKHSPKFQGLSIGKIIWAGYLIIAIITLLSGYSSYLLYVTQIEKNHHDQQQATAKRAAEIFATRLDQLNQSVQLVLQESTITEALSRLPANEIIPPEVIRDRLTALLPQLIRQVVVTSKTLPKDSLTPPLSYACLELSAQKTPLMELHRFGTSDQHLDIAYPIAGGRKLLLSFDPKLTYQWLKKIDSGDSYIELQQQIGGHEPLSFAQTGDFRLKGNRKIVNYPIPGTQFQVAVTAPQINVLTQLERILFFVNFGIALLLIAAVLWATLITIRGILRKDLSTIFSLMKSSGVSLHHVLPIKLGELRKCADDIKRHFGVEEENANVAGGEGLAKASEMPPLSQTDIAVNIEPADEPESKSTNEKTR